MIAIASQITSISSVCSIVWSSEDQRQLHSFTSLSGLCVGNSPVTSEFPAQKTSNMEHVSIWWRHHDISGLTVRNSTLTNIERTPYVNLVQSWQFSPRQIRPERTTQQSYPRDLLPALVHDRFYGGHKPSLSLLDCDMHALLLFSTAFYKGDNIEFLNIASDWCISIHYLCP